MKLPKSVWRWAFYDFANSSYILIYPSFLLPVYFATVLVHHGYSLSSWGWANGSSTLIGVAIALVVGRLADRHSRFQAFKWSIIAAFAGMVAVAFAVDYYVHYLFALYIATNALFILSLALSDSILPYVSTGEDSYHYGGFAWGFGYIGGVASLVIVLALQRVTSDYSPIVFLSTAVFYLLFSIYSWRGLRDVPLNEPLPAQARQPLSRTQKGWLFLGYWLISECVTVIVLFFSIFGSQELHLSTMVMGMFLLLVQLVAFPATWYGGYLTKRYRPMTLLGVSIIFWGLTIGLLVIHPSIFLLILATVCGGLAVGNSQSYLRSQYSTLIHRAESGFQFGLYSIISEAAVFVGPIVYGYASDSLHSQRLPLAGLFVLMVVGYIVVRSVTGRISRPLAA